MKKVLIVGGTHGGELTGVYLIKQFQRNPQALVRANLQSYLLLANPEACVSKVRYIDKDLNRCFSQHDLADPLLLYKYEDVLAKKINSLYGSNVDVIVDLHSSTSDMGICIITYDFLENMRLVSYLQNAHPSVNVYVVPKTENSSALPALCDLGITIEVGLIPEGCLDYNLFHQSELLVYKTLDYYNNPRDEACELNYSLTYYFYVDSIDYPRDDTNEISAMIHPSVQNYELLRTGDPIFITFDGDEIFYEGEDTYPVFVGESAYMEKGIAMNLTQRRTWPILY